MIARKEIRGVLDAASSYRAPVLSLYLKVNPAERDHSPKALATRAKSTLDALHIPKEIAERVVDRIADGISRGRTAVIFADETRIDIFPLELGLPVEDPRSGRAEARWGAPYVTPLLIALDENEHYGVVHVDRDHVRVFELSFGGAEQISSESRLKKAAELDTEKESRRLGRPYVPVRGDASEQLANEHVQELSRLFYVNVAKKIRVLLEERELSQVILVGPTEDTSSLERELHVEVADRIALRSPSLTYRRAPESAIAERLADAIARLRGEREDALCDRAAEQGMSGQGEVLYALQEGRIDILLVPWPLEMRVHRERETGYYYPSGARPDLEELPLADALPDLSMRFNVKLEFILGHQRERLLSEFGGLAGVRRW